VSRGKKYDLKWVGTTAQKQSWWKRNIYTLCRCSSVANAEAQGHRLHLEGVWLVILGKWDQILCSFLLRSWLAQEQAAGLSWWR